jgi:hypothetical protein
MGQTTHQIEAHIEHTREDLGSHLDELEQRVKAATDWKHYFQTNPLMMLGTAFGAGVLLAAIGAGRKSKRRDTFLPRVTPSEPHPATDLQKNKALETWDNIKGALIGVASTRFKDFVGEVIPGFHEQYQRTEEKARAIRPPAS